MINEYIPRVLVVGDPEKFRARIRQDGRAARVLGRVLCHGKLSDGTSFDLLEDRQIALNNKLFELEEFQGILERNSVDYIVFMDYADCLNYAGFLSKRAKIIASDQLIAIDTFVYAVKNCFYSHSNETALYKVLRALEINTLLDADAYLADGALYCKQSNTVIEGICPRGAQPIFTNVYDRQYASSADCCFRHYDAILLSTERDWESLQLKFYEFANMTERFLIFVRTGSMLNKIIDDEELPPEFTKTQYHPTVNGNWFILTKERESDLGLYVVTHKEYDVPGLPDDYITIHAGRALGDDLGYIGDDTGKSISNLNRFLNEMTAAYWIWQNTKHDIVGISHYRRFFSNGDSEEFDAEKILTGEQVSALLEQYDIIVPEESYYTYNQHGFLVNDTGKQLTGTTVHLVRSLMSIYQPAYLDVFEHVLGSCSLYRCNMFITRKYIFDAYCEWLFSFLLKAHEELMTMFDPEKLSVKQKRVLGYLSERLFNMWLLKNNLRIKELPIMENLDKPKEAAPEEESEEESAQSEDTDEQN